jgi:hypothetical protein
MAIPFEFTLLGSLLLPVLVLAMLRINAVMVFLSLCLGQILVTYMAKDPVSFIGFIAPHNGTLTTITVEIAILLIPAVLTCVMMLFSVHGRLKSILNIFPAIGVATTLALFVVPLLTPGLRHMIEAEALWQQLRLLQPVIITVTAFIAMVSLWLQRKKEKAYEG